MFHIGAHSLWVHSGNGNAKNALYSNRTKLAAHNWNNLRTKHETSLSFPSNLMPHHRYQCIEWDMQPAIFNTQLTASNSHSPKTTDPMLCSEVPTLQCMHVASCLEMAYVRCVPMSFHTNDVSTISTGFPFSDRTNCRNKEIEMEIQTHSQHN